MGRDSHDLQALTERQYGAVARAQVHSLGGDDTWISRRLHRGIWVRHLPGVYLTFTGQPPWRSLATAALLYAGPGAALSHRSAAFRHDMIGRAPKVIEVSLPHTTRRAPQRGLQIYRRRSMPDVGGRPRATRPAPTFLDLLTGAEKVDDVVGLATATLRRASLTEIRDELARRRQQPHRQLLDEVLAAAELGVESPLEYRYHVGVERRHGLPRSVLQERQVLDGLWLRADCVYPGLGVRVELDGQLAHPGGRTDRDVWRDNAVLVVAEELTLRYRWTHVVGSPCATARQVGQALRRRGWTGAPVPCGSGCSVGR